MVKNIGVVLTTDDPKKTLTVQSSDHTQDMIYTVITYPVTDNTKHLEF